MASNVIVNFLGDASKLDKTINGVESRLGGLGKFAAAAAVATGVAAAAGAVFATKAYADFDTQMREVYTLMPGISSSAMRKMEDDVLSLSREFAVLPEEIVPALYDSLSAGVPKDNVFEFVRVAQKFAKAGATDVATAVDGLTTVVNAFGLEAEDAGAAADVLFNAVVVGKTTVPELSASLFQVAPIAAAMGVKLEEVAAGFASLTAQGVPTAQAATQMKAAFSELGKSGTKADKLFREVAGQSFPEFIKSGKGVKEAFWLIEKAAKDQGISVMDMFGSIEAGQAVLGLTGEQAGRFRDALDLMGNSAGAVDQAFNTMQGGLNYRLQQARVWVQTTAIQIGRWLGSEILEPAIEGAIAIFGRIQAWWADNGPGIMQKVGEVRDAIVGWIEEVRPHIESWVRDVLGNMKKWWDDNGPTVIAAVNGLKDAIVIATEVIVRVVQYVVRNWDVFKIVVIGAIAAMLPHFTALATASVVSSAKQVAAWVATGAKAVWAAVTHSAQVLGMIAKWALMGVQALLHAAKVVAGWVLTSAGAIAAGAVMAAQAAIFVAKWVWMGVQALASAARIALAWLIALGPIAIVIAAVVGLVAVVVTNFERIKTTVLNAWNTVKSWTSEKWGQLVSAVSSKINEVVEFARGLPGRVTGALGDLGSKLYQKGKDLIQGLIDGIKSMAGSVGSAIANAVPGGGLIGKGLGALGVPGFATGVRDFQGGMAVVGEEGPELVRLPRGSDVFSNEESKQMVAGGQQQPGGNVYIDKFVSTGRASARDIAEDWSWLARTRGVGS